MKECILLACKLQSVKLVSAWLTQFLFLLSDIAVCRTALGQAHQFGVQQRIRSREGDRKITSRSGTLARAVWVTKFSYAGALWSWFSWLYMFELVNCAVFLSWNQESWQIWYLSKSCNTMMRSDSTWPSAVELSRLWCLYLLGKSIHQQEIWCIELVNSSAVEQEMNI